MMNSDLVESTHALTHTAEIVASYLSKNHISATEVPGLIRTVHTAISGLSPTNSVDATPAKPAIAIKKSVTPGYIVCLEDGKQLKMLKRYLRSRYDLTPEAYRAKWNLPHDYPMVAPNYSTLRSTFAKKIGLGKRAQTVKARGKRRA